MTDLGTRGCVASVNNMKIPAASAQNIRDRRVATHNSLCYVCFDESSCFGWRHCADIMRDIDRRLLRQNLKLTPEERLAKFASFMRFIAELRRAGKNARRSANSKT